MAAEADYAVDSAPDNENDNAQDDQQQQQYLPIDENRQDEDYGGEYDNEEQQDEEG